MGLGYHSGSGDHGAPERTGSAAPAQSPSGAWSGFSREAGKWDFYVKAPELYVLAANSVLFKTLGNIYKIRLRTGFSSGAAQLGC